MADNRAKQFIGNLFKWMTLAYENIDHKDMSVIIFVYARDKSVQSEDLDWAIHTDAFMKAAPFDISEAREIFTWFLANARDNGKQL